MSPVAERPILHAGTHYPTGNSDNPQCGVDGHPWHMHAEYVELRSRVDQALGVLAKVPHSPDVRTHHGACRLNGHTDCLAVKLERILGGGR